MLLPPSRIPYYAFNCIGSAGQLKPMYPAVSALLRPMDPTVRAHNLLLGIEHNTSTVVDGKHQLSKGGAKLFMNL